MHKEIEKKLEDIVALLKDPDAVVMDKEIQDKLEKIVALLKNPENIDSDKKEKLKKVEALVNSTMIDPDIDVEYCIPELGATSEACGVSGKPHILLTYAEDEYSTRTRKVSLGTTALQSTPEDLAKHITLAIEEFKDEMDDIKMG